MQLTTVRNDFHLSSLVLARVVISEEHHLQLQGLQVDAVPPGAEAYARVIAVVGAVLGNAVDVARTETS